MTSIDKLPDDVLLEIFDTYYEDEAEDIPRKYELEAWVTLVHVCRRWRTVVFQSQHRLNLRLVCTNRTPARDLVDIWPPLPLYIQGEGSFTTESVDNIVAVLEHGSRVREIELKYIPSSHMETVLETMQKPFPELTRLLLTSDDLGTVPVIPDSFLGRCAPRLQRLKLDGVPFPGLPKLSTTHLANLHLYDIPHSGYISPEVMVTVLSTLTCLETFSLQFLSSRSYPHLENRPLSLTRSVLPILNFFSFKGVNEYLEDLVARIDCPQLGKLYMVFFNDILFDTPQVIKFISHTPALKALEKAHVVFGNRAAGVSLSSQTSGFRELYVEISCTKLGWQVSSLVQVFNSLNSPFPSVSTLEDLYINEHPSAKPNWQDNIDNAVWLELLCLFPSVKNLYLSEEFARRIAPALQELVGVRTTEVLPTLQNIFLEGLQPSGPVPEGIQWFVTTRQATGHPIASIAASTAVSCWY